MSEPIIPEETLRELERLSSNARQIAYQAQEAADRLQSAANLLDDSLKRAREMNRPVYVPPVKVRDGGDKATSKTQGVRQILAAMAVYPESVFSNAYLKSITKLSTSTVRTYMPILREAGFVEERAGGHKITDAGRAALQS